MNAIESDSDMALAGMEALIAPKSFKAKDKDPKTLLIDYDQYVKTIMNFLIVTTGKAAVSDKQKVAFLQAVGRPDMEDLLQEVGKESSSGGSSS